MTTCDMPLGPRAGSKPAGSAEKASLRMPPLTGSAARAGAHEPKVAATAPVATPALRSHRRSTLGAIRPARARSIFVIVLPRHLRPSALADPGRTHERT